MRNSERVEKMGLGVRESQPQGVIKTDSGGSWGGNTSWRHLRGMSQVCRRPTAVRGTSGKADVAEPCYGVKMPHTKHKGIVGLVAEVVKM